MKCWRICKSKHSQNAFDGEGASFYGGRWNSPGVRMIYTAESIALGALEILAHLGRDTKLIGKYVVIPVEFDAKLTQYLNPNLLSKNWKSYPVPYDSQQIGDNWIASQKSVILRVPSVLVPDEHNYLINPGHPDYRKLKIGKPKKFEWDSRLA